MIHYWMIIHEQEILHQFSTNKPDRAAAHAFAMRWLIEQGKKLHRYDGWRLAEIKRSQREEAK